MGWELSVFTFCARRPLRSSLGTDCGPLTDPTNVPKAPALTYPSADTRYRHPLIDPSRYPQPHCPVRRDRRRPRSPFEAAASRSWSARRGARRPRPAPASAARTRGRCRRRGTRGDPAAWSRGAGSLSSPSCASGQRRRSRGRGRRGRSTPVPPSAGRRRSLSRAGRAPRARG